MPQQQGSSKKKKGRAPAHQNTFAFKHNPKSKKTDKILNSPNIHVCRRCHDKIEWRKKYRKYKPLTQPSKCNLCNQRKVKAAYHTICTDCTTSDKARKSAVAHSNKSDAVTTENQTTVEDSNKHEVETSSDNPTEKPEIYRACAVCVKEPALHSEGDGAEKSAESILANETGRMRLRDQRALERKLARQEEEAKQAKGEARRAASEDENESEADIVDQQQEDGSSESGDESNVQESDGDAEEDPFLQAVGGADKLLTGEAYQKMLLERGG